MVVLFDNISIIHIIDDQTIGLLETGLGFDHLPFATNQNHHIYLLTNNSTINVGIPKTKQLHITELSCVLHHVDVDISLTI